MKLKKFKFDILLISILVLSLVSWLVIWGFTADSKNKKAVIEYNNEVIMELDLAVDKEFELYITYDEIPKRIKALAEELNKEYKDKCPIMVCILNGAFVFAADLVREVQFPVEIEFMKYSSYEGLGTTGIVNKVTDLPKSIEGRDIIVIEDIIDTGCTMEKILCDFKEICENVKINDLDSKYYDLIFKENKEKSGKKNNKKNSVISYNINYANDTSNTNTVKQNHTITSKNSIEIIDDYQNLFSNEYIAKKTLDENAESQNRNSIMGRKLRLEKAKIRKFFEKKDYN